MNYELFAQDLVNQRKDIIAAYGYGSAFNHQKGYTDSTKKSLDMLFVVDDIKKWNRVNMKINRNDYSLYTKAIFKVTPKFLLTNGTSVIYNVIKNRYEEDFKYGLIEKERLLSDLYSWKHFYICGRMQKPLYTIKGDKQISRAIDFNRGMALLVSLIILNREVLRVDELLEQICRLSYLGDVRNVFAENPNKVRNIVVGSYDKLKEIYCNNEYLIVHDDVAYVDLGKVYFDYFNMPHSFYTSFSKRVEYSKYLSRIIEYKNLKESIIHPVKQLFVTGIGTSAKYVEEKMKKKSLK